MPALPPMPDLAPFLDRDQFHAIVDSGYSFWISGIVQRTGTDPKGSPKEELVYTVFCPELMDGPGAFSLAVTGARQAQRALIEPLLAEGTVGPCRLVKAGGVNGSNPFYVIEPVVEDDQVVDLPAAKKSK